MHYNNQRGSVLIYSLLLLAFTAIIGFTMHNLAYMEIKMSLYEHRANQARELSEAAVLLTMEELFVILNNDYHDVQELPASIALQNYWASILDEDKILQTGVITLVGQNEDSCTYRFATNGIFQGAKKSLNVQVVFNFIENYNMIPDIDGNLQEVFSYREFLDRGMIISFEEE